MLVGCAQQPKSNSESKQSLTRVKQTLSAQERELASLKEKVFVLESLLNQRVNGSNSNLPNSTEKSEAVGSSLVSASVSASVSSSGSAPNSMSGAGAAIHSEMQSVASAEVSETKQPRGPNGEHFLYAKVIEEYRKKQIDGIERSAELFLKSYPQSVHADNALFLLGQKYLQTQKFEKAALTFEKLQRLFPLGNKYASAVLAQGLVLKKLGKTLEARSLLASVVESFPGSREAFMGKTELALLKVGAK